MASTTKTRSRRSRKKTSTETERISPSPNVVQPSPEIPDTLRNKMQDLMSELIFDAQEVGFVLAELECEKRAECPLVEKTKQLVKRIRELFELQRTLTKSKQPPASSSNIYA